MKLLILGGTAFLGRHITEAALNKGHQVTLFNRNKTNAAIFSTAERLIGDRDGGLDVLRNQRWDAVLDINGYVPRLVADSARLLQESVDHYLFISTGSVYDLAKPQSEINEASALLSTSGVETEEWLTAYGPLKILCEQTVSNYFPDCATILRPGYLVVPHDTTDRMTYWVDRVARGGDVLAPQGPKDPFQMIDVRDVADFAIRCVEEKMAGTFNLMGEWQHWQSWLETCQKASDSDAVFHWVDDPGFITRQLGAPYRPFGAFPLLNSESFKIERCCKKALASGLHIRPTVDTARDILEWQKNRTMSSNEAPVMDLFAMGEINASSEESYWMAGINAEDEKRLLAAWKEC